MDKDRWTRKMIEWVSTQKRRKERPRKTRQDGVNDAMDARNLLGENWRNRKR